MKSLAESEGIEPLPVKAPWFSGPVTGHSVALSELENADEGSLLMGESIASIVYF